MSLNFSTVLAFIIGLFGITLMVFVHELGHFAVARLFKIKVESISLGFGPVLKQSHWGNTVFKICAIPFGGFCKMAGKDDFDIAIKNKDKYVTECEAGSVYSVSPVKRALTYLAGPLSNIVFSFICFVVLLTASNLVLYYPAEISLTKDYPEYETLDCPAYEAGLRTGDTVISINGIAVFEYKDIEALLSASHDNSYVTVETDRGTFIIEGNVDSFGILPYSTAYKKQPGKGLFEAIGISAKECITEIKSFFETIFSIFEGTRKVSETLSSTFEASQNIGLATEKGFSAGFNVGIRIVIYLLAKVSISMATANLLPITALDGGLILISLAELIAGHKFSPKAYIALQVVGLLVIFVGIPLIRILY